VGRKSPILDFSEYDLDHVIADIKQIRCYNRQRHEMEQLTAVCYEDPKRHICVGYKDLGPDEFWVRGHMPGLPVMPGVIMLEAAAQLTSYYSRKHDLIDTDVVGYGGLENVRFRDVVQPGCRFVIVARLLKLRRSILTCEFQCFVEQSLVCEGILKGVALPIDQLKDQQSQATRKE